MSFEYVTPEFLSDSDENSIHNRMLNVLPDDIDKSEASYAWDFTRPTAIEHARIKGFEMNEAVKLIWPLFATDIYLDYHGYSRGITRKEGIAATGILSITGRTGTKINKGDQFSTETVNNSPNVIYQSVYDYEIPESGSIDIEIECMEVGTVGNTPPNTIILKATTNDGILSLTNPNHFSNGIDIEDDDTYRERIISYDQNRGSSYIGNVSDYIRWASSINGVGSVTVIPAKDTTGLVTIVITDGNGEPATQELCTEVYNYIMSPNNPLERLAPINALLSVVPPETLSVTISATVELKDTTIEKVKSSFISSIKQYFKEAVSDNEIRYTYICKLLGSIEGVYDYGNVIINDVQKNIAISSDTLPVIEESNLMLTSGSIT